MDVRNRLGKKLVFSGYYSLFANVGPIYESSGILQWHQTSRRPWCYESLRFIQFPTKLKLKETPFRPPPWWLYQTVTTAWSWKESFRRSLITIQRTLRAQEPNVNGTGCLPSGIRISVCEITSWARANDNKRNISRNTFGPSRTIH